MEEDDLRRAPDIEHFRMAAQLRRTLLTLDHDYLDDARFPPAEGSGVLVLSAPARGPVRAPADEVDRVLFSPLPHERQKSSADASRLPLRGRKLHVHADWNGEIEDSRFYRRGHRDAEIVFSEEQDLCVALRLCGERQVSGADVGVSRRVAIPAA